MTIDHEMASTLPRKFRIAIVGGGLGGLACALALKNCPRIELDLYEQTTQITEIGAGVAVWPRTWDILKTLGLESDLSVLLKEPPSNTQKVAFEMRLSDRPEGFTFRKIFTRDGGFCFHRSDLQNSLLRNIPDSCRIHLSHRLERCEEEHDWVKLIFDNGYSTSVDMVIGADGIKSVVRQYVSKSGELVFTGSRAFRGLIPRERLERLCPGHRALVNPIMYNGKSKHIVVYPINGGSLVNVVAFVSNPEDEGKEIPGLDVRQATTEEMLDAFSGWEPEAVKLLSTIENPSCWPIRDLRPLQTYASRRILLLGDAAHCMVPHLGAGAGQAIEDGYILRQLFDRLVPRDSEGLLRLIQVYDNIRRPFANLLQQKSRKQGYYNELNMPEFSDVHEEGHELDSQQLLVLGAALRENWSWWEDCPRADLEQALQILQVQGKL
ncbi:salicylate hydroxylase [Rhodocollybia butyracea]|uniref:Salicylate hydroxylase n=1 Tax=Rhodocollybia butyracea TaxID=206335 RepID=A0A9P5UGU9_9AGAR|nr:salicylate hydroxylase [Rhodocollybia butyracea]